MSDDTTDPDARNESQTEGGAREELSFSDALEQLERTLQRMEDESIDIDDLADELRRATELLELCRGKLRKAEVEVREIVGDLDGD